MSIFKFILTYKYRIVLAIFLLISIAYIAPSIKQILSKAGITSQNLNRAAVTQKNSTAGGVEDYVLNIFCTEKTSKYIKAVSGSGVFLSDPDEETGIILTNAHVARHLLAQNKQCVGRTGNPAVTTHKLTLRYIPSYWLNVNNQYIIGDPDQSSTGEFDFALIESKRISKILKKKNLFEVLRQRLELKVGDYQTNQYSNTAHFIHSYPAQKTLSISVYSPLYRKKDAVTISSIYQSPTLGRDNNLLDALGSRFVDHGSSGGMMIAVDTSYSLLGLSTILIQDQAPQTVRIVTLRHVFDVLESELKNRDDANSQNYLSLIRQILSQNKIDHSLYSILKNQKLTSALEDSTRKTLRDLRIIKY